MAYTRQYTQGVGWENEPSINTPISAENLNQMDNAIMNVDAAVAAALAGGIGAECSGHEITRLASNNEAIYADIMFDDDIVNHDAHIFFLASEYAVPEKSDSPYYWRLWVRYKVGSTTMGQNIMIYDMDGEPFDDAIPVGNQFICQLHIVDPSDSTTWYISELANISVGGVSTLAALTDTNINTPSDGQILKYNATSAKWINASGGGGRVFSDHIVSSSGMRLNTSTNFLGDEKFAEGDILFLYSEVDATNLDNSYTVSLGGTKLIGRLVDYRDGNDEAYFHEDIQAGTTLVITYTDTLVKNLRLRAIIPAASGGGTTVVANPTGTATDTLEKLQVGSAIYEIPGIDTAWAGKVTAVSGGNITPNNASFSYDPFTDGKFVILDIGVDAVKPGGVTSWSLQYTVDGNTVTRGITDKRDGNAYDPDFDDDLVSGSVIVLQYFEDNKFACVAVLDQNGGGGASTLAALTDTNISTPSDGQFLKYDATSGKWINASGDAKIAYGTANPTEATGGDGTLYLQMNPLSGTYKYLKFDITARKGGGNSITQFSQLGFLDSQNQLIAWPAGVTWSTNVSVSGNDPIGQGGKLCAIGGLPTVTFTFPDDAKFDLSAAVNYRWYTANDAPDRDPVTWSLSVSDDGINWMLLDARTDETITDTRNTIAFISDEYNNLPAGISIKDIYYNENGNWLKDDFGGGASSLADLSDTTISSPTAAQPLTYDATNSKWINGGIIPAANGGTGNNSGYVQAGRKANTNIGTGATAEGARTTASGNQSHAEGVDTVASNTGAHAEGSSTQATGVNSHAEGGGGVVASGGSSHAEGASTQASGACSHAEGQGAKAQAAAAHAQNFQTTASANYSSAAGYYTTAGYQNQFVIGKYNDNKSGNIFEVGIGANANAKANGLELDTSGNLKVAGTITDGNGNELNKYLEQTVTLSTSASTTVTFTDSSITANSFIEYACSQWDLVPESITGAAGSCTIVLPKVDSAQSVTVRIYVR